MTFPSLNNSNSITLTIILSLLILLTIRTIYVFYGIRWNRLNPTKRTKRKDGDKIKTIIVLGSGGHTTEILQLTKNLNRDVYFPIIYVAAETDTTSEQRLYTQQIKDSSSVTKKSETSSSSSQTTTRQQQQHRQTKHASHNTIYKIPRSREVGQSFSSSVITTLYSLYKCIYLIIYERPNLVLCNGPGTCLPIIICTLVCRVLCIAEGNVVFVESFCRIQTLSLTGLIVYKFNLSDMFIVHWKELKEKFNFGTQLISTFVNND